MTSITSALYGGALACILIGSLWFVVELRRKEGFHFKVLLFFWTAALGLGLFTIIIDYTLFY